jgi:predicted dehydrogenase
MRVIVVGLGIQGKKRLAVAGGDVVATVDPVSPDAAHKDVKDVPLGSYDAALVCVPDEVKPPILEFLLKNGKHVLTEKPLLAGVDGIRKLDALARASGAACYTAYNHRFEPHIVELKKILDSGRLGALHYARFFYGNGTARDVRGSPWRDKGMGVLADIGSHLLDTSLFLFGRQAWRFRPVELARFENKAPDYVSFVSESGGPRPYLSCEMTLLSWRNTFQADVVGEKGSAHIQCLCKWGPSTLTVRERVLPSGRPREDNTTIEMKDPTWVAEYEHFKRLCARPSTNLENDVWIEQKLQEIGT